MKIIKKKFGSFIRDLRISQNIGQRELANKIGIAPSYLNDIEKEKRLKNSIGLIYRDDCTDISLSFNQSFTRNGNIGPRNGVTFKIILRTLGGK